MRNARMKLETVFEHDFIKKRRCVLTLGAMVWYPKCPRRTTPDGSATFVTSTTQGHSLEVHLKEVGSLLVKTTFPSHQRFVDLDAPQASVNAPLSRSRMQNSKPKRISHPEFSQPWMVNGAWAGSVPIELAIGFFDRNVVDASLSLLHQTFGVELPILISVSAEPLA